MLLKIQLLIIGFISILAMQGCRTCDCFDDPDYEFNFDFNFKSYNTGISVKEFLSTTDSTGKPKYYKIKVYKNEVDYQLEYFRLIGTGKGDSMVSFDVYKSPKKITLDIEVAGIKHQFTKFELKGYKKGSIICRCFTPTQKTVTMDDSIVFDALNSSIVLKK
ncbi:MAG: hypothetical protein IT244_03725 [Bacteroidia bacterium]|nr:hypothetical protein [Bacteroidia bacterium]